MRLWAGALCAVLATGLAVPAAACGADSDCVIGERTYRLRMPAGHDGTTPVGAILYAHGYRGTAAGAMRNRALSGLADELGVALIAAQSAGDDWAIPGVPMSPDADGRAELAYFEAVLADAAARVPLDRRRVMATGFSAGGMMVWELICRRGGLASAYAPIAGTFWAPVPEDCPSDPVDVIHVHGTADRIVPVAGRAIGESRQGDLDRVLAMYGQRGGYEPAGAERRGDLDCALSRNPAGRVLELCLHPGGHSLDMAHLRAAWERFAALGRI